MILFIWMVISQLFFPKWFLRTSTVINNAQLVQSLWCKSVIRCQRGFSGLIKSFWQGLAWWFIVATKLFLFLQTAETTMGWHIHSSLITHLGWSSSRLNSGVIVFLVYVTDLPEVLTTNAKLFAEETSLFSIVHDSVASSSSFNDDCARYYFSLKTSSANHGNIYFSKAPVIIENFHNYLAFFLVSRHNFLDHINEKILKGY